MYERDDIELLLPAICWTHHLHPEQGMYGRKHTCVRDESYWLSPPRKKPKGSVAAETTRIYDGWLTPAEVADLDDGPEKRRWAKLLENACDPNDRKGFSNPKTSNTVWAELIDTQTGWDKAPLTDGERAVLYLTFSQRWTSEEIAYNQGITDRAVRYRIERAIEKIAATLNGDEAEDEYDEEIAA